MKKLLIFILLALSFNAFSDQAECENLFNDKNYDQAIDVCYDASTEFIFNDNHEILEKIDGDPKVHFMLGYMYKFGLGTPRNDWAAVYWYTKSADKGNPDAQLELGALYYGQDPYDDEFKPNLTIDLGLAQYYLNLACKGRVTEACILYERLLEI